MVPDHIHCTCPFDTWLFSLQQRRQTCVGIQVVSDVAAAAADAAAADDDDVAADADADAAVVGLPWIFSCLQLPSTSLFDARLNSNFHLLSYDDSL